MKVILKEHIEGVGHLGDVMEVSDGFARNFLLPRKLAIEASPGNRKQLEEKMKQHRKKEDAMLAEINSVVAKLTESPLRIGAKSGTSGKIFGSVTSLQISRAIRDQKGYNIDRKKITLPEEVKELGSYKAHIDFGNGKATDVDFEVVAE